MTTCAQERRRDSALQACIRVSGGDTLITGMHGMFFSSEVEALRAFFRDKLGFPCYDAGGGWLIFEMPPADLGVHPITHPGAPPSGTAEISFSCDDVARTRTELEARGVEFTQEIQDQGFGLVTRFKLPGGFTAQLYQPKYAKP